MNENYPRLAVWPLGRGVIMTSYAVQEKTPMVFFRAVPDDLIDTPGTPASYETWDSLAESPTMVLTFEDIDGIESHIKYLQEFAEFARKELTKPQTICPMCDDTGYLDYAAFCMEPCGCKNPS